MNFNTDEHRIFMHDNLQAHHSAYVHQTVRVRANPIQFDIVACPPYHPKLAPIEYKICDVTGALSLEKDDDWDTNRLEQAIRGAINNVGPFDSTFWHCGYIWV